MEKSFVINGKFMEDRMQGIVRYSREILKELDKIIDERINITMLIPPTAQNVHQYSHIKIKTIGNRGGIFWEQIFLRRYIKQHKACMCINLCNVTPLFVQPGITVIHDIMYKVNPSHYTSFRNRLSRYWHMLQYSYITKHEKKIITVSHFSKNEIEKYYPKSIGKITIIPCAWQHVKGYKENYDWQKDYPFLKKGKFFFSLATLAKNKNGKWIIEVAKRNPEVTFAIGGKYYETEYDSIPSNVHLLGFISDETICSLIKNCRAFIFPSLYEGFGLPPLEALALGADVIASNTTSLPEILGKSVHYINPYDVNVDLYKTLHNYIDRREIVLNKYSWRSSALKLKKVLHEMLPNN